MSNNLEQQSTRASAWREGPLNGDSPRVLGRRSAAAPGAFVAVTQIYINHVAPFEVVEATANRTRLVAA